MNNEEQEKKDGLENNPTDNLADNMPQEAEQEATSTEETGNEADNLADELAKMKDAYLRLMAEYDNFRKRTVKEKTDLIKNGGEKVLSGLLPIADDFQRALEVIDKAKDLDAVKEGIDLIYCKFTNYLTQNGVKAIETVGQAFNDDLHEAVAIVPAQSEEQKGLVIDDVQTGYTLNDKVIRHAKVVVAN